MVNIVKKCYEMGFPFHNLRGKFIYIQYLINIDDDDDDGNDDKDDYSCKSVNFQAMSPRFCMEVDLDNMCHMMLMKMMIMKMMIIIMMMEEDRDNISYMMIIKRMMMIIGDSFSLLFL